MDFLSAEREECELLIVALSQERQRQKVLGVVALVPGLRRVPISSIRLDPNYVSFLVCGL